MPNYREQNGEVGSYNNLKVYVVNGYDFQKMIAANKLSATTIYCLKEYDPYHKLLPDCMYAYMINPNDPDNLYCLGTMGNYGKVNFKKNIGSCETFALAFTRTQSTLSKEEKEFTTDYSRDPDATAAIDDILSEIRSWSTQLDYSKYTETVDKFLEALA